MEKSGIKDAGLSDTGEEGGEWMKTRNNFPTHIIGRILSEELFHHALDEYLHTS